jgi:PAS domain S-box-containing protein
MSAGTILLVEDNPITRNIRRAVLEIEGYDVVDASNGRAALELAAARRPDIAILDDVLSDMDGLQLLAEVRRNASAPELPAIVITNLGSRRRLEELRARTDASTHVLGKPVEPWQLLEVVQAQLAPAVGRAGGQRILVVDDEPVKLELSALRLRGAGYEVETASGGAEALEIARQRRPDAIFAAVMMPSMDGFTFCREARRNPAFGTIPIVLVSAAYVDEADRELARQMGANALVVRTPDLREALAAIEAGLGGTLVAPPPTTRDDVTALHQARLLVQLERQAAHNQGLLRQAAIQTTALSIVRGLSELLAEPEDVPRKLGRVLVHSLDAAGLSTGLLYLTEPGGEHRLQAQFGIPADRRADAEALFGHPQLVRRIIESGKPVVLSSGSEDADAEARDFLARLGQSSVLVVPVVVLGEALGEIVLASESHDLSESSWLGFARSLALQFGQTVALGQSLRRLAASEARMKSVLDAALDAVVMMDEHGRVTSWNARAETLFGWSGDEAIGRTLADLIIPPRYRERHMSGLARFLETGDGPVIGRRVELSAVRRDGSEFPVELTITVLREGGVYLFNAFIADITDRKRAAQDLEQRMEVAAFAADVGAALVGSEPLPVVLQRCAEAMMRHLDPAFARIWTLDATGDTLELQASAGLYTHLDGAHARVPVGQFKIGLIAAERQPHLTNDVQHDPRVGDQAWARREGMVAFAGYPLVVGDHLVGVMAMFARHPLSKTVLDAMAAVANQVALGIERTRGEAALRTAEQRLHHVVSSSPSVLYSLRPDGDRFVLKWMSENVERLLGYTAEEVLAEDRWVSRVHPEDRDRVLAEVAGLAASGYVQHEYRFRGKDGTYRWLRDEVRLLRDASGAAAEAVGSWSDVVARKDAELRLQESEEQYRRAQKMEAVGQLAGGIAHDFNNLLGVITGNTELLLRELPADSRERKRGEEIQRATDRAAALTRQLLAFGRRQVLQPAVLDLNAVVVEVEAMLRRLISANIQIVTVPAAELGKVRADAGQIGQVLMNLAINARDAMPSGGRLVIETGNVELDETYVRMSPQARPGPHVMLAVSDTGHGMDAKTMSRIFEPFFTTKEEGKGTGLGLATVYGIVRQSGGVVNVYSEPGQGTTFKVFLPRVDAEVVAEARVGLAAPPGGGTETILVVEDAESLRLLVRELLESAGYTVLDAEAPDKALSLLQSTPGPIHLVLTDMVMPRMSGQELATRVAALKPEARVVFMSGYSDQAIGDQGALEPGTPFLQKPFTLDALMRTIRGALDAERPTGR